MHGTLPEGRRPRGGDRVTRERLERYISMTRKAAASVTLTSDPGSHLYRAADDVLSMVGAYLSDAAAFAEKGRLVDAFACVNYAHGWLDAGARLGLYRVSGNRHLFTIDE